MELDYNTKFKEYESYEEEYLSLMEITLAKLGVKCDPIVSVSLVDNRYIHRINKKYRGIDRPTDVISFAFLDDGHQYDIILFKEGMVALGDIYISVEKAIEQANEYGHSIKRELSFLFVHGLLHLLGYDHMTKEDEEVMFTLQEAILKEKGI